MKVREPNHELDDELLSAYLDGELSSEDRAAVEARLATDPAAQQLLHELRSVSQAVQALPLEKVGRDLSQEVVRRAQQAKRVSLKMAPARSTVAMPKLPVFASKRAWIWASLALAAGLLIMVVQSVDERRDNLPAVAQRDNKTVANQPVGELKDWARREVSRSESSESKENWGIASGNRPTDKPAAVAGPPQPHAVGQLHDTSDEAAPAGTSLAAGAAGSPAPKNDEVALELNGGSNITRTPAAPEAADKLAQSPQAAGRASSAGGEFGDGARPSGGKLQLSDGPNPLVVVHVVAKRAALDKKSFEQLLGSNGIAVEPDENKSKPATDADRYARPSENVGDLNQLAAKAAAGKYFDMVLVEAPAPAIVKFVASLNQDSENYPNIEVAEPVAPQARFDAKSVPSKKIAEDLSKYNRGAVPQQQKDSLHASDLQAYYYFETLSDDRAGRSSRESELGAVSGVEQSTDGALRLDSQDKLKENGRAWRIQVRQDGSGLDRRRSMRSGGIGGQLQEEARQQATSERKLKERLKSESEKLRVLFVLSPQEAAASTAPAAATSAPAAASSPPLADPAK